MKTLFRPFTLSLLAATLLLSGCSIFHKHAAKEQPTPERTHTADRSLLTMVSENAQPNEFVTSKIKFTVEMGSLSQTLTGNLKMKRDDVIRLQLMAFGFVEAGRLEFTKDYVLIMDRINKQFLRVPYHHVDFLRNSGINFYTLQAMFWNELFLPGHERIKTVEQLDSFATNVDAENAIVSFEQNKMAYSWLVDKTNGRIKMANVLYTPRQGGNTQLNWDYRAFTTMGRKPFPNDMHITLTTPSKEVSIGLLLNYLGNESDWETRTKVSSKYSEVNVDEILRRFMAL